MRIEWHPRYETGIAAVDDDHRRLVALINDLDSVLEGGGDLRRAGEAIDALIDYADYHFAREETLMVDRGYGGAAEHALAHAGFGQYLGEMVGICMLAPDRRAVEALRDYLGAWLIDHILVEDMKFAALLRDVA